MFSPPTGRLSVRPALIDMLWVGAVPRKKLRMIPNGIDTVGLYPARKKQRQRKNQRLGIGAEFVWLAVGRLVKPKDYPLLFSAHWNGRAATRLCGLLCAGPLEQELRDEGPSADEMEYCEFFLGRRVLGSFIVLL